MTSRVTSFDLAGVGDQRRRGCSSPVAARLNEKQQVDRLSVGTLCHDPPLQGVAGFAARCISPVRVADSTQNDITTFLVGAEHPTTTTTEKNTHNTANSS